ncbi:MAG: NUDIX hydrolase [Candidatus Nanohaloarchaea archaeon]
MNLKSLVLWKGEKLFWEVMSRLVGLPIGSAAVVVREGEVLAVDTGGYLMLPGGMVNRDEGFEEAAKREVREETGYDVRILERIRENVEDHPGVEMVHSAEITGGEPEGSWEGEPVWIPLEEAPDRNWRWNRDIREYIDEN